MSKCSLCEEFKKTHFPKLPDVKKYFEDSRIFSYNNYLCVFPTLGCFVKGYILLSTIDHYISLCNCPDDIINKIEKAVPTIRTWYEVKMNCRSVFFEHGTVNDFELSSASVCHIHMHFLPVNEPIWESINSKYNFEYYVINSLADIKKIVYKYNISSYLLFGDYDDKIYLINCPQNQYPSQFLRKVMYEYYFGASSENKWDWKINPCYDIMTATIDTMDGLKI